MKWKDIKQGTLIKLKNQVAQVHPVVGDWDTPERDFKYILILSDLLFKDHPKSRKRKFYFKAAFYDDMTEKVFTASFDRSMMRGFMKKIDDDKLAEKIQQDCFMEEL